MPNPVYTSMLDYTICKHKSTKFKSSEYCYVSLTIELNIIHLFTQLNNQIVLFLTIQLIGGDLFNLFLI